jgi:hypothetical protein
LKNHQVQLITLLAHQHGFSAVEAIQKFVVDDAEKAEKLVVSSSKLLGIPIVSEPKKKAPRAKKELTPEELEAKKARDNEKRRLRNAEKREKENAEYIARGEVPPPKVRKPRVKPLQVAIEEKAVIEETIEEVEIEIEEIKEQILNPKTPPKLLPKLRKDLEENQEMLVSLEEDRDNLEDEFDFGSEDEEVNEFSTAGPLALKVPASSPITSFGLKSPTTPPPEILQIPVPVLEETQKEETQKEEKNSKKSKRDETPEEREARKKAEKEEKNSKKSKRDETPEEREARKKAEKDGDKKKKDKKDSKSS